MVGVWTICVIQGLKFLNVARDSYQIGVIRFGYFEQPYKKPFISWRKLLEGNPHLFGRIAERFSYRQLDLRACGFIGIDF